MWRIIRFSAWAGGATLACAITACGGAKKSGQKFIPVLPVECDAGQSADCAGTGLKVFTGLARDLNPDCRVILNGLSDSQRRQSFDASATDTSTRRGIYLVATMDAWQSPLGAVIDTLPEGVYQICAFIDTNANDRLDTGEPVGTGEVEMGTTHTVLTGWTTY